MQENILMLVWVKDQNRHVKIAKLVNIQPQEILIVPYAKKVITAQVELIVSLVSLENIQCTKIRRQH